MSWPAEEWKVGLPAQALRAIAEVEQRLERLQKERQQKQVQLDTLEAVMHKERKKHEEERLSWSLLSQQNRSLAEAREQVERARQRLSQELRAKEAQRSCLETQLIQATRRQAELEEELRRCQSELERLQSKSRLVLPSSSWGSPTPWTEGGCEAKAEPGRILAVGKSQNPRSSPRLTSFWENEKPPATCWQQEATCPGAPPGSPVPAENGGVIWSASGEQPKKDNEELRLALTKAENQKQEKERELRSLQKLLEVTQAELAQWKRPRSSQSEGLWGSERMAPRAGGRSVSSAHWEPPAVKRGAAIRLKGPDPQPQSTEQAQEELQALQAEVLMLRQHLAVSEGKCKSLLETSWQTQETRTWAQAKGATSQKRGTLEIQGNGHDGGQVLGPGQREASEARMTEGGRGAAKVEAQKDKGGLELLEVEKGEAETEMATVASKQVPRETLSLMEKEDHCRIPTLAEGETNWEEEVEPEGDVEALREELRALAAGKAEAEAQASLAQQKLQSLQATLGKQTERLAQAMETQSRHVEELLTDAEEKDQVMQSLVQELEETKKALGVASAESQWLRMRLMEPHRAKPVDVSVPQRGSEAREVPVEGSQGHSWEGQGRTGLTGPLKEEKLGMQEQESVSWVPQENKKLHKASARQVAWDREKGGDGTTGPPESVCQAETVGVLQAAQKRELWLQWSQRDVQTQTEGPYCGPQRQEHISVAFDDTQYEPYGLPEVVMKGFADIPSGPLCPYVLRRGILGSAPIAQMAPRAEPEEDSPEVEEGTGV